VKDPTDDQVAVAVGKAIESDDELTAAARLLADTALQRAMYFLQYGSPIMQMQIIRSLMPAVGKALVTKADEDAELKELRDNLTALHQAALGPEP
jgi:hypothetical protein